MLKVSRLMMSVIFLVLHRYNMIPLYTHKHYFLDNNTNCTANATSETLLEISSKDIDQTGDQQSKEYVYNSHPDYYHKFLISLFN